MSVNICLIAQVGIRLVVSQFVCAVFVVDAEELRVVGIILQFIINRVERLNHLVHMIQVAIVCHYRSLIRHTSVGDVEIAHRATRIPRAVREEILVVVVSVDALGLKQFVAQHRQITLVVVQMQERVARGIGCESHANLFDRVLRVGAVLVVIARIHSLLLIRRTISFRRTEIHHLVPVEGIVHHMVVDEFGEILWVLGIQVVDAAIPFLLQETCKRFVVWCRYRHDTVSVHYALIAREVNAA